MLIAYTWLSLRCCLFGACRSFNAVGFSFLIINAYWLFYLITSEEMFCCAVAVNYIYLLEWIDEYLMPHFRVLMCYMD
jgi:hypothetical protein